MKARILDNFINPYGENRQTIEELLYKIITQLLDFTSTAAEKPCLPEEAINIDPDLFGIPETGINLEQINDTLQSLYSTSMNPANPQYIGHMDSIPALTSIIGDMVASAINNNLLSLEMSPFLTKLEYGLIKQFATLFGLPESAGGVFLSGGSLSNLQALVVARNSFKGNIALSKLVIFVSEHAHVSIQKAAMVMGLGAESVIKITTNSKYQMDVANLELQIKKQQEQGNLPLAIVATAGTTVTGSIDPLESIANLARTYGIWLHVDAIYGGALIFSDKYKHLLSGIEMADSIAFNPQKWLYIAKTCSMVLFRGFNGMVDNFRINTPYMKEQDELINLGEISIQGSRHAESLKLWLSLLNFGINGYRELIGESYFLTKRLLELVKSRKYLELLTEPDTNLVCFRLNNGSQSLDELNLELQQYLLRQGNFFVSIPKFKNQNWLRVVILNPFITEEILNRLFCYIDRYYYQINNRLVSN